MRALGILRKTHLSIVGRIFVGGRRQSLYCPSFRSLQAVGTSCIVHPVSSVCRGNRLAYLSRRRAQASSPPPLELASDASAKILPLCAISDSVPALHHLLSLQQRGLGRQLAGTQLASFVFSFSSSFGF